MLYDYADLTEQEFKDKYLKKTEKVEFAQPQKTILSSVSDGEIDWQAEGYMARVKDQGTCGSCWSFGAIGAAEMLFNKRDGKKYPNLIELSEQQLIDCCHTDDSNGCNGGQPKDAMTCLTKGIGKETDYPYFALENQCKAPSTVFSTVGYGVIDKGNNDQLLERLKVQALDIGVNAAPLAFRFFSSGVITEGCTWTEIDHDVVMVGAVTVDGKASWKIKNSWGPNWGKDGYLYVLRETGIKPALCAVNMKAYFPTL
jgi:C1A family cysteine protease